MREVKTHGDTSCWECRDIVSLLIREAQFRSGLRLDWIGIHGG